MKRTEIIESLYRRLRELNQKRGTLANTFYDEGQVQGYILALDGLEDNRKRVPRVHLIEEWAGQIKDPKPIQITSQVMDAPRRAWSAYELGYVHALQVAALLTRRGSE